MGCMYQFSNTAREKEGVFRKIAVESIHNNTKTHLPFEGLWEEIQRRLILSNRARLTSSNDAEFLIRTTVTESTTEQHNSNNATISSGTNDYVDPTNQTPSYPSLKRAQVYSTQGKIKITIKVEVWDLMQRKIVLEKSYGQGSNWQLFDYQINPNNMFIRSGEKEEHHFQSIAQKLSKQIVNDFFSSIP